MKQTSPMLSVRMFSFRTDLVNVAQFQRFRKQLFVDHLGWDLVCVGDREVDAFDTLGAMYCAVFSGAQIVAGFRAIRTSDKYLALTVFPQLATLRPYPRRHDVWEISRFGVAMGDEASDLARLNYGLMFRFALTRKAAGLVAVADLVYERYLRALGIRTRRYGPPQTVGVDRLGRNLVCVAGEIPMPDQDPGRIGRLTSLTKQLEVADDALVLGPQAISA